MNDIDITKELAIGQLIDLTNDNPDGKIWERTDYSTYSVFFLSKIIDKTKSINFRIYHYKDHDNNILNVYMDSNNGSKQTNMMTIRGDRVFELIALIKILKNYYYKNEILQN